MPTFRVATAPHAYDAIVERGVLERANEYIPRNVGKTFVITTEDVWKLYCARLEAGLRGFDFTVLLFPGGEERKRISFVEAFAEEMVSLGGDRSSLVIAFGGGIVTDLAGFLAAIFMRGIPVLQIPTTLLAQVDAAVGGKTGANLVSGKNLIGSFHQPLAVLIDPTVLSTLPEREYKAGLYEIVKCGVIRSPGLFRLMDDSSDAVLEQGAEAVDQMIAESVRIKAAVVSADERESDVRRILNFGHTLGHALEAETGYSRYLHGEAVAFGMKAATQLAAILGLLADDVRDQIVRVVDRYGPIPPPEGIQPACLIARLASDKKTVQGQVHFVLPVGIGEVKIVAGVPHDEITRAIEAAIQ
jgi:3-dehydroquinate synthase